MRRVETLEDIRQRKMQELMQQQQAQQHIEAQKERLLRSIFTPEAMARYTNLKLSNPSLAAELEQVVLYLYQAGQIKTVSDKQLKELLIRKRGMKRETKITRK